MILITAENRPLNVVKGKLPVFQISLTKMVNFYLTQADFEKELIEEKVKKFNDTLYNEEKPYNLYYGVEIVNEYETLEAVLEEVKKIYAALDCGDRVYLIE